MFIPKDRETSFCLPKIGENEDSLKTRVRCVVANRDRSLIAVVSDDSLYIWLPYPSLCLASISDKEKGEFRKAYWRHDSTAVAITTNRNQILVYTVNVSQDENCYNLIDSQDAHFQRTTPELFLKGSRPVVTLAPGIAINLAATPICCVPSRDDLLVCMATGFVHHVSWLGVMDTNMTFRLSAVPFAHDQLQSKPEYVSSEATHVVDAMYAPLVGGYVIVLSNGHAALLTSSDSKFGPNSLLGVWATNLKNALCCDVNHKFRLLYFGCRSGDICAYNIDETTGALTQTFRVAPRVTNGPEISGRIGPVTSLRTMSEGHAFAAIWGSKEKKSQDAEENEKAENSPTSSSHPLPRLVAVFTPFGAQSYCSLEGHIESGSSEEASEECTAVEWGPEGTQLWTGTTRTLRMQNMMRNAACGNSVMEHCERAVLVGDSQVLIGSARDKEKYATAPHAVWDHVSVPHEYLASNWPLRFATVDRSFNYLVVAGTHGFAYCTLSTHRWKIFGNESQEKNLLVTGGVFIWRDTVGVAACSADDDVHHLSFYPMSHKLDERFASRVELESRPVSLALRGDICAVFDVAFCVNLYQLTVDGEEASRDKHVKVSGDVIVVIRMHEWIPHPACVVSLQLTQLELDINRPGAMHTIAPSVDTVLVNVSGRLITLSANGEGTQLNQPMVIASFVEQMWHDRCVSPSIEAPKETSVGIKRKHRDGWSSTSTPQTSSSVSSDSKTSPFATSTSSTHLSNALWIACGAKGIKVWLPLVPGKRGTSSQEMTFIAKRIMLPFELDIYPIVICATDCVAIGVESQLTTVAKTTSKLVSMHAIHRNSEVFVHHLLRQLLKRNLGVFALEVAASCRRLAHFPHALELLLHGVLEEEATSSEPIPDPLLPRCVAFIHEFPEFLRTVAHCARKTELALWPALFNVTGSPNDLFEECLRQEQLDTAASYVIVVQNFESVETSMQQAARLLREALSACQWSIAREMVRFARSIAAEDIDVPSSYGRTPPPSAKTSLSRRPTVSSPSTISEEASDFVFSRFQAGAGRLAKVRHSHTDNKDSSGMQRKDSTGSATSPGGNVTQQKNKATRGQSSELSPTTVGNKLAIRMDEILETHAWHLLNEYRIRDLGFFWSELQFDLCGLLETRRKQLLMSPSTTNENCFVIEDFPLALTRLHHQFEWPYPVVGTQFVHQLEKKLGSLRTSQSTASLNGLVNSDSILNATPSTSNTEMNDKKHGRPKQRTTVDLSAGGAVKSKKKDDEEDKDSSSIEIHEIRMERVSRPRGDTSTSSRPPTPNSEAAVGSMTPASNGTRSQTGDWQGTEVLVGEKSLRGTAASSSQLDYMLQLFAHAYAIDWVFLLCLLRRDESRLRQVITTASVWQCGEKNFARVRFACSQLARWAVEKCCGYASILQAFDAHLAVVAEQAGIKHVKYVPRVRESTEKIDADKQTTTSRGRNDAKTTVGETKTGKNSRLSSAFAPPARRERSRSADRAHRGVRKYDDVVCAEGTIERVDEDGCQIM